MRKFIVFMYFFSIFSIFFPKAGPSQACTSFLLDHGDQPVMGTNLDWCYGDGLAIVNKRGLVKTAIHNPKKHRNPIRWKSAYGSITFTHYGREWTWGGMNEAGLACSTMSLQETEYPATDHRPSIHAVQYLQYQLDNFECVEDVIAGDSRIRIRSVPKGLGAHYFFCDRSGNTAVVEFIEGKMMSHTRRSMPLKVLTNCSYEKSLEYAKKFKGFGGKRPMIHDDHALNRFVRAASMAGNYNSKNSKTPINKAFKILDEVAMKHHEHMINQWGIVYDLRHSIVYFRTRNNPLVRVVYFDAFSFSCLTPVKILKIEEEVSGDITYAFRDYTWGTNRKMFQTATQKVPYKWEVTEEWLDRMARYPESFRCEDRRRN